MTNFSFKADSITASHDRAKLEISVEGVDGDELLEQMSIKDIVSFFDKIDLLNAIGESEVQDWLEARQ